MVPRHPLAAPPAGRARRPVDDPVYLALIAMMITARKAKAIKQGDLAASLGQPQSYVSKIENRERRIDVGEFVAWMHALGGDPAASLGHTLSVLASGKVEQQP